MNTNMKPIISPIQPGMTNKQMARMCLEAAVICLRVGMKSGDETLKSQAKWFSEESKKWIETPETEQSSGIM